MKQSNAREHLPHAKIGALAMAVADEYGLKRPEREELRAMFSASQNMKMPIITQCAAGLLWVDEYYIAYQLDENDVRYVYIAPYHIFEEVSTWKASGASMPEDVRRALTRTKRWMRENNAKYWVHERWRSQYA